jgi:hypothetical protein
MLVLQSCTNDKELDNENPAKPNMPFLYLLSSMIFIEHHSYNVNTHIKKFIPS